MPLGPANRLMPTLRRVVLAGAVADRTDGQLLGAFIADRDADAFAGLVRRHGPMVIGTCRRVIGDHATADDAFQAVFLVLARRASAIKPREQVGNWLYGVAYRTAIKARAVLARRRSREKQVDVMPELAASSPPDVWSDLQPVIDEELARLPDKLRLPVVLCDLEGRTQREVARQLGIPPATLTTRLATARRTLAQRLTVRGVTLSGGALAGLLTVHGTATAVPHTLASAVTRAAEAVAGGSVVTSLVSSQAIQLSEGVMRMMLLTKLKAVAVTALTVVALTGGLGLGIVPDAAGADPKQTPTEKSVVTPPTPANNPAAPAKKQPTVVLNERNVDVEVVAVDDLTFLHRLTHDLRGTAPTDVETWFFVDDKDADKRAKVVAWMTDNEDARLFLAKKLGVPADRLRLVRIANAKGAKAAQLVVMVTDGADLKDKPMVATFTHYGKQPVSQLILDRTTKVAGKLNLNASGDRVLVLNATTAQPSNLYTLHRRQGITTGQNDSLWLDVPTHFLNTAGPGGKQAEFAYFLSNVTFTDFGQGVAHADFDGNGLADLYVGLCANDVVDTDNEFLKRVVLDVRGTAPTTLEEKYFAEDKHPKKREKLLDTLLKDPVVAKKLGEQWKKKMLAAPGVTMANPATTYHYLVTPGNLNGGPWLYSPNPKAVPNYVNPVDPATVPYLYNLYNPTQPSPKVLVSPPKEVKPPAKSVAPPKDVPTPQPGVHPQADRLEKLVGELLATKKTDAEMLEAVTLATVGRLPTDAEKRLTLGLVTRTTDRRSAWMEVAKALAATEEGTRVKVEIHQHRTSVEGPWVVVPVPRAKP